MSRESRQVVEANDLGTLSEGYSNSGRLGPVRSPDTIDFTIASAEYLQLSATESNAHLGDRSLVLSGPQGHHLGDDAGGLRRHRLRRL